MRQMQASEPLAARREMHFRLVSTDGASPALLEAGGQPQIRHNGGAWTDTGISTLTAIGNGEYVATLTIDALSTPGDVIDGRYKSVTTFECPSCYLIFVVNYDPAVNFMADNSEGYPSGSLGAIIASLQGRPIVVQSPIAASGKLAIIRGDSYMIDDNRALEWSSAGWPDLTGASVTFVYRDQKTGSVFVKAGNVFIATGENKTVQFEIEDVESASFPIGKGFYHVQAVLADGHSRRLVNSSLAEVTD